MNTQFNFTVSQSRNNFNTLEFEGIRNQAGDSTFIIYAKDIVNLAFWGMTAMARRTNEELQVLNTLQAQTRQLQKEQYNQEEKLQILMANAAELIPFYCDTPEKEQALIKRKKERGW